MHSTVTISIIAVLVIFGSGAFYIFRKHWKAAGLLGKNSEKDVVPISDLAEIEGLKEIPVFSEPVRPAKNLPAESSFPEKSNPRLTLPLTSASKTLNSYLQLSPSDKEIELEEKLTQMTALLNQEKEASQAKIFELSEAKRKFEEALTRELKSKEASSVPDDNKAAIQELEERLEQAQFFIKKLSDENRAYHQQIQIKSDEVELLRKEIREKPEEHVYLLRPPGQIENEEKLKAALKTITQLTEENQRLNLQVQMQMDRINELNSDAVNLSDRWNELQAKEKIKMETLEHEIELQKKVLFDERQRDVAMIEKLKNEKVSLVNQLNQSKNLINALETDIKGLYSHYLEGLSRQKLEAAVKVEGEMEKLKLSLAEARQKLSDFEVQAGAQKSNDEKQIRELALEVDRLKNAQPKYVLPLAQSLDRREESKKGEPGRPDQSQELIELTALREKLESQNALLREKNKLLVYELSKSRAQAIGLERICEDLKTQMDQARV